jgi:hypothetical protein
VQFKTVKVRTISPKTSTILYTVSDNFPIVTSSLLPCSQPAAFQSHEAWLLLRQNHFTPVPQDEVPVLAVALINWWFFLLSYYLNLCLIFRWPCVSSTLSYYVYIRLLARLVQHEYCIHQPWTQRLISTREKQQQTTSGSWVQRDTLISSSSTW